MSKIWLLSLKTRYALSTYSRQKQFEYRKNNVGIQTGDYIFIYETSPVKKITGLFTAGVIVQNRIEEICPIIKTEVELYLSQTKKWSAIEIVDPINIPPKKLLISPPQSYFSISEEFLHTHNLALPNT